MSFQTNVDDIDASQLFENENMSLEDFNQIAELYSFDKDHWRGIAFRATEVGNLHLLHVLIRSKKVPILIKNDGGSLLHTAVRNNQFEVVEWLVNIEEQGFHEVKSLFPLTSTLGETALHVAVQNDKHDLIDLLTSIDFKGLWALDDGLLEILKSCQNIAQEDVAHHLHHIIQSAQLDSFVYQLHKDVNELKDMVNQYEWFQNQPFEFNDGDQFNAYYLVLHSAELGDCEKVKWFLEDWNLSIQPPRLYAWKGLSVADYAVLRGEHSRLEHLEKEEGGRWKLESLEGLYGMVRARWNGNCEDLIGQIADIFNKDEKKKRLLPNGNVYYDFLCQKNSTRSLEVIKLLSQRFSSDGVLCVPRLDVLVMTGQLNILKWLVSEQFFDLTSPIERSQQEDEIDETDISLEFGDDDCAICYEKKWKPNVLDCGHSFCYSCIRRICGMHVYNPNFQCPLCRSATTAPKSITASAHFLNCIKESSPWLSFDNSLSFAEVLVGLAAGRGSIFILEWLINEYNIDLTKLSFEKGWNVMHIAASQGHSIICQWLLLNKHLELAKVLDEDGFTPAHLAMSSECKTAYLVVEVLQEHGVMPEDWVECALKSKREDIIKVAKSFQADELAAAVPRLLASPSSSLGDLVEAIEKSSLDLFVDSKPVVKVVYAAIMFDRFDVLRWIFANKRLEWLYVWDSSKDETILGEPSLMKCCWNAANTFGINDRMEIFMKEINEVDELKGKMSCFRTAYSDLVKDGAEVNDIIEIIGQQKNLIPKIPLDFINGPEFTNTIIKPLETEVGDHVCNTPKFSFKKGYVHILKWILEEQQAELQTVQDVCKLVDIFQLNPTSTKFVFSWMEERGIPLTGTITSESKSKSQDYSQTYENILDLVVSFHALSILCSSLSDSPDEITQRFELIEFFCSHHEILKALQAGAGKKLLFHYLKGMMMISDTDAGKVSQSVLNAVITLVNAGVSIYSLNDENKSFAEQMIDEGNSVHLETIRWLALEKGVDVQFLEFGRSGFRSTAESKLEFQRIQEEQEKRRHEQSSS